MMKTRMCIVFATICLGCLPGCRRQREPQPGPVLTEKAETPKAETEDSGEIHIVKRDEDVYSVAIWWGVNPEALMKLNNLTGVELTPGQRLKIPKQGE